MARRKGDPGSTGWFGSTGTFVGGSGQQSETQIICHVPGPTPTDAGTDSTELPIGTLLRTFGAVTALTPPGGAVRFDHPFAALHHDEAVLDESGALNFTTLDLADEENLGFEGLYWLGSCILWEWPVATVSSRIAKAGCSMRVDSKAKRKLRTNDIIALDLANIATHSIEKMEFSWHLRFLIKYA